VAATPVPWGFLEKGVDSCLVVAAGAGVADQNEPSWLGAEGGDQSNWRWAMATVAVVEGGQ
jgi:hypothetical protein